MNCNTTQNRFNFSQLSDKQIECLGAVAFQGNHLAHSRKTIESLVRHGLIQEVRTEIDPLFTQIDYEMDWATHMDFCQWCAEQAEVMTEADCDW